MAIEGTDAAEVKRLAAELSNSLGTDARAPMGPESPSDNADAILLKGFGPEGQGKSLASQSSQVDTTNKRDGVSNLQSYSAPITVNSTQCELTSLDDRQKAKPKSKADCRVEIGEMQPTKNKRDDGSSSEDSGVPRPRRKKSKRKSSKKKKPSDSSSSSDSSSESSSSSSESDSSQDSEDADKAELVYDITDFQSADLPDLPDKWDEGFRKLRSYVPLTLFRTALLENYYDDEVESKIKDKSEFSKSSLKTQEKQLTYGDFIEMSDLEERYAREIYGLHTYADYVAQHKRIVSDLKKTYNCWMIGLRYHLKVRTVIFRRRKLIKSKVKGKTVVTDKVKIPNGLQPAVERQARHDADRAGDLQFIDNPYATGGPKFGYNFATGRQAVPVTPTAEAGKTGEGHPVNANRGKRGGSYKKPYPKRSSYPSNRYNRNGGEFSQGQLKGSLI